MLVARLFNEQTHILYTLFYSIKPPSIAPSSRGPPSHRLHSFVVACRTRANDAPTFYPTDDDAVDRARVQNALPTNAPYALWLNCNIRYLGGACLVRSPSFAKCGRVWNTCHARYILCWEAWKRVHRAWSIWSYFVHTRKSSSACIMIPYRSINSRVQIIRKVAFWLIRKWSYDVCPYQALGPFALIGNIHMESNMKPQATVMPTLR